MTASRVLAAAPDAAGLEFFERKVRPVLAENCFSCHGAEKQKAELRLDSPAAIRAGGEGGSILIAGQPERSRLIAAVSYQDEDLQMPPKKRLPSAQIADLVEWVKRGAPMPGTNVLPAVTRKGLSITDKDRAHWSFKPVKRPPVPSVSTEERLQANPIDDFLVQRLTARGLSPNPRATKNELIRRAYYDLTGLPPSPADVKAFLANRSESAWPELIEQLLASPRYGEKWARHWLDLVRFAESNSYERDNPKPHAWRYRDYVIRAFNSDKPYDRFVREQLAGDEFPEPNDEAIIATGFYRLGIWDDEPADKELARYDELDDLVTTTGQVFLGLTVDCARCHDHKIDPIPQRDYYRLLAFFQNVSPYSNSGPALEVALPGNPTRKALAVTEAGTKAPATFVLLRGNPNVRGEQVEPGFPEVISASLPIDVLAEPSKARSTGRRTALANWITSPVNPLTARVMVNRIWQHHFGRGIVRSPNNFGLQGDAATHPELLDWMASEFVRRGWSLKEMHRLIMTSQAYQMSSRGNPEALKVDPANDLFWRFDMRRLTAEEIRDSILAVNGSLNLRMFGPGIYVEIPKEVLAGQSRPGSGWGVSSRADQARRSIYIHVKRSLLPPILEAFDLAETDRSTPVRFASVQPTQALGLLNSEFLNREAEVFAARLRKEAPDKLDEQVRLGLSLVTSREPTSVEVKRGVQLIESLKAEDGTAGDKALNYFCLMALNLNEMVYLD